jgi:hypothetical protein
MSQRVLYRLGRIKPTAAFLGVLALVFAGLLLPGTAGAVLLLVLAAGAGWLLAQTWSTHPPRAKAMRLLVLGLVVVLAVAKLT